MGNRTILLVALLAATVSMSAQPTPDLPERLQLLPTQTAGAFRVTWQGQTGRTYFVQYSEDLVRWQYLPVVEAGAGVSINYGFASTAPRCFVRLQCADRVAADPCGADFDGDGVSNWVEIQRGLNPMVADLDTDKDGIPDAWETAHGLNPSNPNDATDDSDGDGVKANDEFTFGLDPRIADAGASAPVGGRSVYVYTANDELSTYTPAVGSVTNYSPDAEGNVQP